MTITVSGGNYIIQILNYIFQVLIVFPEQDEEVQLLSEEFSNMENITDTL